MYGGCARIYTQGPDNRKAWRPSSTPTSNRDAKIVGTSANATGHYISMDLTSYGRVPGKSIKPHGRALGVNPAYAALVARGGSPGLPAKRPMHQVRGPLSVLVCV